MQSKLGGVEDDSSCSNEDKKRKEICQSADDDHNGKLLPSTLLVPTFKVGYFLLRKGGQMLRVLSIGNLATDSWSHDILEGGATCSQ